MVEPLRFTVYFDGTGNNKDLHTPIGTQTNVARLYELDMAKGNNLARNSGHEPLEYDVHDRSGQSEKVYFDGVGSQAVTSPRSVLESATGLGSSSRIEQAYNAIVAFHNKYPEQPVSVSIVGFSRGAAQARALANEFIERGVPKWDAEGKPSGDYLIQPGQAHIKKLGLFDTVASYGNALGDTHLGKNLEIGKNVDSTTHLVAMNEYRDTFRLTSALRDDDNSRIEELKFAGAHSQVGGGYRNDVLAAGPFAVMYDRLQSAGIQLRPMQQEDIQWIKQYNELIKSPEKVQEALIDSRLKAGNEAFIRRDDGAFQVLDNSAFPLERGSLNFLSRQSRPFEHEVQGRKVLFETDDSLSKSSIRRGAEVVGDWFVGAAGKIKDQFAEFFGRYSVQNEVDEQDQSEYDNKLRNMQGKALNSRMEGLKMLAGYSRPDFTYIESLKLESVPFPALPEGKDNLKVDKVVVEESLCFMAKKALAFSSSVNVFEASQSENKVFSGLVIYMDEDHILQRIGRTSDFVIHNRRDLDPGKIVQMGRSTAIMNAKGPNDSVGILKNNFDQGVDLSKVIRQ
ncbi:T6SS phospholipase effector Tle1-like catalytic domain-containing protein [Pseudomonas rhizoryzae]|uniref:phospholipase effector Tle1 domain-containing protein n=1 Tax=Pseudomonas rhizoryzae TaxID=2571129 RepID=UPI0009BD2706|nr:DUF2235 domain-containing protein [Pseudomonas rhizoryzae]